jgi:RNA polymerase sigma-70 factor (ECF subfamily)
MNFSKNTDEEILKGCKAGKRYFQNLLYEKYARSLFAVCLRYSPNYHEAEDLLQESFVKIFQSIRDYRGEGSFEGWMRRIVVNSAITAFKRNSRNPLHHSVETIEDQSAETENEEDIFTHINPAQAQSIMGLIQELPVGYNQIFNLYVFDGYTHKEISELLQISENTSKSQLAKARKYLRRKLTEGNLLSQ